jgi:hypothetical protein
VLLLVTVPDELPLVVPPEPLVALEPPVPPEPLELLEPLVTPALDAVETGADARGTGEDVVYATGRADELLALPRLDSAVVITGFGCASRGTGRGR